MIPSLDGWRAIAILIVAISHAGFGHLIPGGLGVTIFFFLSGYLITSLIIKEYERHGYLDIYKFYIRRFLRLMPPLTVTLLLVYGLTYIGLLKGAVDANSFFAQLLYFANYYWLLIDPVAAKPLGTGIFWSLAVEEHFYLIFPIIFILCAAKNNFKKLGIALIVIALAALIWRWILTVYFNVDPTRTYYATDTRFDSIIFGCLLAIFKNPMLEKSETTMGLKQLGIIGGALTLLLVSLLFRDDIFRETLRYTVQGIALMPLFYYSILFAKSRLFKLLNTPILMHLGKLSYSMYLIHFVILSNFSGLTNNLFFNISIAFTLTYLYALAIDKWVDQPMLNIRDHFRIKVRPTQIIYQIE